MSAESTDPRGLCSIYQQADSYWGAEVTYYADGDDSGQPFPTRHSFDHYTIEQAQNEAERLLQNMAAQHRASTADLWNDLSPTAARLAQELSETFEDDPWEDTYDVEAEEPSAYDDRKEAAPLRSRFDVINDLYEEGALTVPPSPLIQVIPPPSVEEPTQNDPVVQRSISIPMTDPPQWEWRSQPPTMPAPSADEEELEISVGDVVELASGSPYMTVTDIENGRATCVWFNPNENQMGASYNSAGVTLNVPQLYHRGMPDLYIFPLETLRRRT